MDSVRFAERRNLVSASVPSYFNWPLPNCYYYNRICSMYWKSYMNWSIFLLPREGNNGHEILNVDSIIIQYITALIVFRFLPICASIDQQSLAVCNFDCCPNYSAEIWTFELASWSSGQSLWLLIMRSRVRFPALPWEFSLKGKIPAVTMVWVD